MYTFDWSFPSVTVVNSGVGTFTNYVKEMRVAREAYITTDSGKYRGTSGAFIEIPDPTPETYVNFDDVTKDTLVGWTTSFRSENFISGLTTSAMNNATNIFLQNTTNSFISTEFANYYENPNQPEST